MKKRYLLVLATFIVATTLLTRSALAFQLPHFPPHPELPPQVCGEGLHVGNPHCITPTPTEEPTVTPTPTEQPCEDCVEITPTPTREVVVSNPPQVDSGYTPPAPSADVCTLPIQAPLLQGFKRLSPTSVQFDWWKSPDAETQSILYGYSADALNYSVVDFSADTTSFTLNDLQPNVMIFAMIRASKGACTADSQIVDP